MYTHTHTHTQVTSFDHTYSQPSAVTVNGTLYELQNPFWDPLLLEGLAFLHFAVSAILIASYWFLKVGYIKVVRGQRSIPIYRFP